MSLHRRPRRQDRTALASLGLAALALTALLAAGGEVARQGPLPVEADWHARAQAWFDSPDEKDRKQQMRAAGKALKQPCRYCHTPKFDGYTDKLDISRQMMALSKEHQLACGDCHTGKTSYTERGLTAAAMWAISREKRVFCDHCHPLGQPLTALTPAGEAFKPEWRQREAALRAQVAAPGAAPPSAAPPGPPNPPGPEAP